MQITVAKGQADDWGALGMKPAGIATRNTSASAASSKAASRAQTLGCLPRRPIWPLIGQVKTLVPLRDYLRIASVFCIHEYLSAFWMFILGLSSAWDYEGHVDKAAYKPLWTDLAMAFALVALCLRVLIPSGYMPVFSANGAPTMVICTGAGPKIVTVQSGEQAGPASADDPSRNDHDHKSKSDCGFSGLAQVAPASEPRLALAPAALVAAARLGPLVGRELTLPLRARPPPQTGPPNQA